MVCSDLISLTCFFNECSQVHSSVTVGFYLGDPLLMYSRFLAYVRQCSVTYKKTRWQKLMLRGHEQYRTLTEIDRICRAVHGGGL